MSKLRTMVVFFLLTIMTCINVVEACDYNDDYFILEDNEVDYYFESSSEEILDSTKLIIEDLGIEVQLYYCNGTDNDYTQTIVNNKNSAAILDLRSQGCTAIGIADHYTQGFDGLFYATVGTEAKFVNDYGKKVVYECIEVDTNGINDGWDLWSKGRNVLQIFKLDFL